MFTGIVEDIGILKSIEKSGSNVLFTLWSKNAHEFYVDQSVAHNGCCLTLTWVNKTENTYGVTAILETLEKTNLAFWKLEDQINLERSLQYNGRLDGHVVQGHVDTIGTCVDIQEFNGSWKFGFSYNSEELTVQKGSICINGVSLTVVDSEINNFSVCIIPYTFEHTNFRSIQVNSKVNLEFDIIGKYISKYLKIHGA